MRLLVVFKRSHPPNRAPYTPTSGEIKPAVQRRRINRPSKCIRFFRYIIFELSVLLIYDLPFPYKSEDPSILQPQKLRSGAQDFQNFHCKK